MYFNKKNKCIISTIASVLPRLNVLLSFGWQVVDVQANSSQLMATEVSHSNFCKIGLVSI